METRCTNDPLRNEKRRFRLIWLMAGFLAMRTPPQERIELRYAGNFEGLGLLPQISVNSKVLQGVIFVLCWRILECYPLQTT